MPDHYKILGVERTATKSEIEGAYFKLKSRFNSEDLEDYYFKNLYRQILQAYNILSNENLREKYDKNFTSNTALSSSEKTPKTESASSIEYFRSPTTLFEAGQKILVEWKTVGIEQVSIEPFGEVKSSGSKLFEINDQKQEVLTFTLKAVPPESGKVLSQKLVLKKKKKLTEPIPASHASEEETPKNIETNTSDETEIKKAKSQKGIRGEKKKIRKFGIPAGTTLLLVSAGAFFFAKSDFFQSEKRKIIQKNLPDVEIPVKEEKQSENNGNAKNMKFAQYEAEVEGEKVTYYDAEAVLKELVSELEKYSDPSIPGLNGDVRHFFNNTNNPVKWNKQNTNSDSDSDLIYEADINLGLTQEPYYEQKKLVVDKLELKKYGETNSNFFTKRISVLAKDSGPPFWKPDGTWEALEELFNSEFKDVILWNLQGEERMKIFSLGQIPEGSSFGYMIGKNNHVLPLFIEKIAGTRQRTSININFLKSFNSIHDKEGFYQNSDEENITSLLEVESSRDFYLTSSFYAMPVVRYWDNSDLSFFKLKKAYENAWNSTFWSKNRLVAIQPVHERAYDVITEFTYADKKNDTITQISANRYVFNSHGLITEVYGVKSNGAFESFRDEDFDIITDQDKIRRLLKAEDTRDFDKIASYYDPEMQRYWHLDNPDFSEIKKVYDEAWGFSQYSSNSLLNIIETSPSTYDVEVRFEFYNNKTKSTEVRRSMMRYVFNRKGLITEVYGLANTEDIDQFSN